MIETAKKDEIYTVIFHNKTLCHPLVCGYQYYNNEKDVSSSKHW